MSLFEEKFADASDRPQTGMRRNRRATRRRAVGLLAAVAVACAGLWAASPAVAAVTTIAVGNEPSGVAFTPNGATAYVTNSLDGTVSVVDVATGLQTSTIAVGAGASGIAVTPDGSKAYVTNWLDGTVSVIDVASAAVTAITVGDVPLDVAFTPNGSTAYVTNFGSDSVSVIAVASGTVTSTISIPGPLGVDLTASTAYVTSSLTNVVSVVDVATNAVTSTIPVGAYPFDIQLTPDESTAYVTNYDDSTVSAITLASGAVAAPIPVGVTPLSVAVTPDGSQAFVTNQDAGTVSVIATATNTVSSTIPVGVFPSSVAFTPNGTKGYVTNFDDATVSAIDVETGPVVPPAPVVDRISGTDRYATAVEISKAGFTGTAPVVYVATGTNFPDALGAAPAAAKQGGPLLLTLPTALPAAVRAEIVRLNPAEIVVVGGLPAVSAAVFTDLSSLAPSVVRVAGVDRYDTARQIVARAFPGTVASVYVATGTNFPDALSAAGAAGAQGVPVLLVNGGATAIDTATRSLLTGLGATSYTIAGGANVVSAGIQADVAQLGTVTRLGGADRYATSELINKAAFTNPQHVYFATGVSFPDALAGAVLAGANQSPLYVVPTTCVPAAVLTDLGQYGTTAVTLFGGLPVLNASVAALQSC